MVVLLVLLTIIACLVIDRLLRARKKAAESLEAREPAPVIPFLVAQELPGGLFLHGGHTWAKLEATGSVQVGLDGFAHRILGRVDRYELPPDGTMLRQGEPAFAVRQSGKRIDFVSPVDGVVCGRNGQINADTAAAAKDPYEKGWVFAIRPSNLSQNLKKLRIGGDATAWLEREVRSFSEFLSLHWASPQEVGVTLADGGIHAEGIMESMDGEILQIAIRKYFR